MSQHLFAIPPGTFGANSKNHQIRPISELFQSDREHKRNLKRKHSPSSEEAESESESGPDKPQSDVESPTQNPEDARLTTRLTAQKLLSAINNPSLYPHPSSIPDHVQGFRKGSARPRAELFEQQRRIGLLVSIMHRCAQFGDWKRASRAVGLLIRSGPSGQLEQLMVGSPEVTGLAAECLMRRPQLKGQKGTPITYSGLQAAINLYERLLQWFPRTRRHKRRRINWYPTLYTLKIYALLARYQEQVRRISGNALSKFDQEDEIRKTTLNSLVNMEEALDNVLEAPLNRDEDLLRLRGMMAQWEADLIFPINRLGNKLWTTMKRYEAEQEGRVWDESSEHRVYSHLKGIVFTDGEAIVLDDSVMTSVRESTVTSTRGHTRTTATPTPSVSEPNRQASVVSSVESIAGTETSHLRNTKAHATSTPRRSIQPSRELSVLSYRTRQTVERTPTPSTVSAATDKTGDGEYVRAVMRAWNMLMYRERDQGQGRVSEEEAQKVRELLLRRRALYHKAESFFEQARELEAERGRDAEGDLIMS